MAAGDTLVSDASISGDRYNNTHLVFIMCLYTLGPYLNALYYLFLFCITCAMMTVCPVPVPVPTSSTIYIYINIYLFLSLSSCSARYGAYTYLQARSTYSRIHLHMFNENGY